MSEAETKKPIPVDCPEVVIPSADDLEKIIIHIGNTYGWEYIQPIEKILGAFPLSHTWPNDLDIPELEWEGKYKQSLRNLNYIQLLRLQSFFCFRCLNSSSTTIWYRSRLSKIISRPRI